MNKNCLVKTKEELEVLYSAAVENGDMEATKAIMDEMERLKKYKSSRIDPNVVVKGAIGLVGTVLVLYFERSSIVVSKSFGTIFKTLF